MVTMTLTTTTAFSGVQAFQLSLVTVIGIVTTVTTVGTIQFGSIAIGTNGAVQTMVSTTTMAVHSIRLLVILLTTLLTDTATGMTPIATMVAGVTMPTIVTAILTKLGTLG